MVYKLRDVVYEHNRGEIIMSIFQYKKRASSNHVSERDRCNEPGLHLLEALFVFWSREGEGLNEMV